MIRYKQTTIISILIALLIYEIHFSLFLMNNNKKYIFTFWEPREKIPGFLKLCIKTWKRFLSEYEIIILDYNISKFYLGEELFSNIICENMSIMVQSDAIRVAMLNKFGGIWMDADTIITNREFIKYFKNFELAMVMDKSGLQFIGFIYASKNSIIIKQWLDKIIYNVKKFKSVILKKENTTSWKLSWKEVNAWYYLGNGIIDQLIKNAKGKQYLGIDYKKINVFPELDYFKNASLDLYQAYNAYNSFYFQERDPQFALNYSKGLIFLHNSWTLLKYKKMTEQEFVNKDILLSKLLKKLLNFKE